MLFLQVMAPFSGCYRSTYNELAYRLGLWKPGTFPSVQLQNAKWRDALVSGRPHALNFKPPL